MNNNERIRRIYDKAEKLKLDLKGNCNKCKGSGQLPNKDGGCDLFIRQTSDCACMVRFKASLSFMVANIPPKRWKMIFDKDFILQDKRVREYDILSKRYKRATWIYRGYLRDYIKYAHKSIEHSYSFLFCGTNSVGKTTTVFDVMIKFMRKGLDCYYFKFEDLLNLIIMSYTNKNDVTLLNEINNVDLLCIDEIGKESKKEQHTLSKLEGIIKERDENQKSNILVSNMKIKEFSNIYGKSVYSALEESYKVLEFNPRQNFRLKEREEEWNYE